MIINRIKAYLEQTEFLQIHLNVSGIHLYHKVLSNTMYAVVVLDFEFKPELSKEGYLHTKQQIISFFSGKGYEDIQMLFLLCGRDVEYMKRFCTEDDLNWIIDTSSGTLMLFENQDGIFLGFKEALEDVLEGKSVSSIKSRNSDPGASAYFSHCNTVIILINALVFLFTEFKAGGHYGRLMYDYNALDGRLVAHGEIYRLFTYMFLHSGINHIVNNMIILSFIGSKLEYTVGRVKFILMYFLSGIIAGAVSIGYNMSRGMYIRSVGASGAIFGLVGAVAYIVLVNRGRLEDIGKRQILIFALLSLYGGFVQQGVDNAAHVGGFIGGIILAALLYRRRKGRQ